MYLPRIHQQILMDDHRFQVVNAGRRFGKTLLLVAKVYRNLSKPFYNRLTGDLLPHKIGYYTPTYRQAKEVMWERAKDGLAPITAGRPNKSDLIIPLVNGAEFRLYGTDQDPDSLRGTYKTCLLLDEFAYQKPGIWQAVLRPMISDSLGEAGFFSTPRGYGEFYDLFQKGQSGHPDWISWSYPSVAGGFISPEEVEAAREDMDDPTWRQEYLAEFLGHSGLVCKTWSKNNIEDTTYRPDMRLYVTCDFNVDPMCWAIAHRYNDEVHFIDELCIEHTNTFEAAEEFARRYAGHRAGITITGDASGNNRSTKSTDPLATDFTIIRNTLASAGFPDVRIDIRNANPAILDRVAAWNLMVCNSAGVVRVRVNPKCKWLIWNCENLYYIEGSSTIWEPTQREKVRNRDMKFVKHVFDAASYLVERYYPIKLNKPPDNRQNQIITRPFRM